RRSASRYSSGRASFRICMEAWIISARPGEGNLRRTGRKCFGTRPTSGRIGAVRQRVKIIVNPVSGKGKALRRAEEVAGALRALGCEVDLRQTAQGGDARRLAGES